MCTIRRSNKSISLPSGTEGFKGIIAELGESLKTGHEGRDCTGSSHPSTSCNVLLHSALSKNVKMVLPGTAWGAVKDSLHSSEFSLYLYTP